MVNTSLCWGHSHGVRVRHLIGQPSSQVTIAEFILLSNNHRSYGYCDVTEPDLAIIYRPPPTNVKLQLGFLEHNSHSDLV